MEETQHKGGWTPGPWRAVLKGELAPKHERMIQAVTGATDSGITTPANVLAMLAGFVFSGVVSGVESRHAGSRGRAVVREVGRANPIQQHPSP